MVPPVLCECRAGGLKADMLSAQSIAHVLVQFSPKELRLV